MAHTNLIISPSELAFGFRLGVDKHGILWAGDLIGCHSSAAQQEGIKSTQLPLLPSS